MLRFTIGRNAENDIVIDDPLVSSSHAVIWVDEMGQCFLEDKNSTNGSFVNKKKLSPNVPHKLRFKDELIIGRKVIDWKNYLLKNQEEIDLDKTRIAQKTYKTQTPKQKNNEDKLKLIIWALIGLSLILLILAYVLN